MKTKSTWRMPSHGVGVPASWFAGIVAAGLLFAPLSSADTAKKTRARVERQAMSDDMHRAIAWEHWKDEAAAIQARKEARHPSVTYGNANRSADREAEPEGRVVKDPGEAQYRRHKKER
jgi:hypothetical protein